MKIIIKMTITMMIRIKTKILKIMIIIVIHKQ